MVRWGMVIDLDKCTGCQACSLACASENNLPTSRPEEVRRRREVEWNEILTISFGEVKIPLPRLCMHCDIAACVKVCPTGSRFYYDEGRIVLQSYDRCIGCRLCMCACPYNANYFIWSHPEEEYSFKLNSDMVVIEGLGRVGPNLYVSGTPQKCIFCFHRLVRLKIDLENKRAGVLSSVITGEASWEAVGKAIDILMRYLIDPDNSEITGITHEIRYLPACVATCPSRARIFGDLDDKNSLVAKMAKSPRAFKLLEELGTEPKVIYLAPKGGGVET